MRILFYGNFVDKRVYSDFDDDIMMIGMKANLRHQRMDMLETLGGEYYYVNDKWQTVIVKEPLFIEKLFARIISHEVKKIVGYRSQCQIV